MTIITSENGRLKVIGDNFRTLYSYNPEDYAECYVTEYLDSKKREESKQEPIYYDRKEVPLRWERYSVLFKTHIRKKTGGCRLLLTVANVNNKHFICADDSNSPENKLFEAEFEASQAREEARRAKEEVEELKAKLEKLQNRSFWGRLFNKNK